MVTQSLYRITLYAEAASSMLEAGKVDRAAEHLRALQETSLEVLREIRLLIFELHPPVLEREGRVAALQARLEMVEARGGVQAQLLVEGSEQIPLPVKRVGFGSFCPAAQPRLDLSSRGL